MAFGIVLDAFGCWVLEYFGGRELLDIAIPTLIPPYLSMEVGRVGNNCVAFWACHFCYVVVVPAG